MSSIFKKTIILILFLCISGGLFYLALSNPDVVANNDNTIEYSSTIKTVKAENSLFNFTTEDFPYVFEIFGFDMCKNKEAINELEIGDEIKFSVLKTFNYKKYVIISSLTHDDKELLTFDEYNKIIKYKSMPTKIFIFAIALLPLSVDVYLIIKIIREKKKSSSVN